MRITNYQQLVANAGTQAPYRMKAARAACVLLVLLALVQPFDAIRLMKDGMLMSSEHSLTRLTQTLYRGCVTADTVLQQGSMHRQLLDAAASGSAASRGGRGGGGAAAAAAAAARDATAAGNP